ncbi:hypothetical protein V3C99_001469, partial [Haemonchus contortus]
MLSGFHSVLSSIALSSRGPALVGHFCSTDDECVSGARCSMGLCTCFDNYVAIKKFCWKKISPEESGCTFDEQCEAMWPNATCQSSICKCPSPMRSSTTREGTVNALQMAETRCFIIVIRTCRLNAPYLMSSDCLVSSSAATIFQKCTIALADCAVPQE